MKKKLDEYKITNYKLWGNQPVEKMPEFMNVIDVLVLPSKNEGLPLLTQGSQYTTKNWKELLNKNNIQISMDGKGRCKDNIWIERFWRTIKQEYIYINPSDTVDELRKGIIDKYIKYYNFQRPHSSLDVLLPAMKYGLVA